MVNIIIVQNTIRVAKLVNITTIRTTRNN